MSCDIITAEERAQLSAICSPKGPIRRLLYALAAAEARAEKAEATISAALSAACEAWDGTGSQYMQDITQGAYQHTVRRLVEVKRILRQAAQEAAKGKG